MRSQPLDATPSQAAHAAGGGGGGGGTFGRQVHAPDLRILLHQLPQLLVLLQGAREGRVKTPQPMANMQRAAEGHAGAAAAALTRWGGMREMYTMPRRSYFSLSFFSFFALRSGSLGAWRSSCCSWSLMTVWECVGLAAAPPCSPPPQPAPPGWHGMPVALGASCLALSPDQLLPQHTCQQHRLQACAQLVEGISQGTGPTGQPAGTSRAPLFFAGQHEDGQHGYECVFEHRVVVHYDGHAPNVRQEAAGRRAEECRVGGAMERVARLAQLRRRRCMQ